MIQERSGACDTQSWVVWDKWSLGLQFDNLDKKVSTVVGNGEKRTFFGGPRLVVNEWN